VAAQPKPQKGKVRHERLLYTAVDDEQEQLYILCLRARFSLSVHIYWSQKMCIEAKCNESNFIALISTMTVVEKQLSKIPPQK
jgi:predicted neutral ceramidase superfamily lipid hydrolase